ncbi:DUF1353 domain-containing protein [Tellurirhabdus rosea]|uniref:DUF1353 domain-containing protein n=1 Tax=Tellurirhabdus rosea TaxID=2674997 RepID=UPI002253F1B2|nr:DUF1353 domain-containing protein [Tellurirhabdus rosea]
MVVITRSSRRYRLPIACDSTLSKTDQVVLQDDVQVELFDGRTLLIPKGFISDFHSTPRAMWSLVPAYHNRTNLAALVHDYLYMHFDELNPDLVKDNPRKYADQAYLMLMQQFNPLQPAKNLLYYAGVRAGGWYNWRKFRRAAALH